MWQSHLAQQAAGVCSPSKVAGGLLLGGGGRRWDIPLPGPLQRSVSPPRSFYIFISIPIPGENWMANSLSRPL